MFMRRQKVCKAGWNQINLRGEVVLLAQLQGACDQLHNNGCESAEFRIQGIREGLEQPTHTSLGALGDFLATLLLNFCFKFDLSSSDKFALCNAVIAALIASVMVGPALPPPAGADTACEGFIVDHGRRGSGFPGPIASRKYTVVRANFFLFTDPAGHASRTAPAERRQSASRTTIRNLHRPPTLFTSHSTALLPLPRLLLA